MPASSSSSPRRLLTVREAADYLGLSVSTLNKWRVSGEGPRYVKLGAAVRHDIRDLDSFIEAGVRNSTSDQGGGR
jgi:excisionase family DNA binding protein